MKATVLDLRRRMSDVLRALERNEPVTILFRGKEKGVIYPPGARVPNTVSVLNHAAFGMWKDHDGMADVPQAVRQLRKGRFDDV